MPRRLGKLCSGAPALSKSLWQTRDNRCCFHENPSDILLTTQNLFVNKVANWFVINSLETCSLHVHQTLGDLLKKRQTRSRIWQAKSSLLKTLGKKCAAAQILNLLSHFKPNKSIWIYTLNVAALMMIFHLWLHDGCILWNIWDWETSVYLSRRRCTCSTVWPRTLSCCGTWLPRKRAAFISLGEYEASGLKFLQFTSFQDSQRPHVFTYRIFTIRRT